MDNYNFGEQSEEELEEYKLYNAIENLYSDIATLCRDIDPYESGLPNEPIFKDKFEKLCKKFLKDNK